jgi:hypothetical protein
MAAPGTYGRGYLPPSRHRLLMTVPYRLVRKVKAVPAFFATLCSELSYFLNQVDGDCVTAEECQNINTGTGHVAADADVQSFARQYGLLNGAELPQVMQIMETDGFPSGGTVYKDGPFAGVNWKDYSELCAALVEFQASGGQPTQIKLGVAADQMEAAMNDAQPFSFFVGFQPDPNIDHCTAIVGFGTAAACLAALNEKYGTNIALPSTLAPTAQALIHWTWKQYQIMDFASLVNVCDEAYLRNPSLTSPAPGPAPTPVPPSPSPTPTPAPVVSAPTLTEVAAFVPTTVPNNLRLVDRISMEAWAQELPELMATKFPAW